MNRALRLARSRFVLLGCLAGCSGGGSGSGFQQSAALLAVEFLDPNDVNPEPTQSDAPQSAPLNQQIRFTFSAAPDPQRVNSTVLPILDEQEVPVPGTFTTEGAVVTFTPELPTRPIATTLNGALDDGGAGLDFNAGYSVRAGPKTFAFITNLDAALQTKHPDPLDPKGVFIRFRTQPSPTADAYRGLEARAPQLVAVDPRDGATGISPNLHGDPDQRFAARRTFTVTFDAPIRPDGAELDDARFELIDLDDRPSGFPQGLPLGIDVRLLSNRLDRAVVEVVPSGILPFGHLLALQYDRELKGLAESGVPAGGPTVATTFTIATDDVGTVHDRIVEAFDDNAQQEVDLGEFDADADGAQPLPADWNVAGSSLLQAALEFDGTGVLGRFAPPAPPAGTTHTTILDTAAQVFPLLDGSTPDAPPRLVVNGGVFEFTEIDLPAGVEVRAIGPNPLVFKCSGSVRIAGSILLAGADGTPEFSEDRAYSSIPGGAAVAGGGRGGDSHPTVFFPPDQLGFLTLVSPSFAETGLGLDPVDGVMKRLGGTGARNGILDSADNTGKYQTNQELGNCDTFRNGNGECKIAGGGGGSMLRAGCFPLDENGQRLDGIGNVVPDGTGGFLLDPATTTLACGDPGAHPFFDDGRSDNDFVGKLGQLTRLVGGQGGGGGGTLTESYYCGNWCDLDALPDNDRVCDNADNLPARGYAPSVGDSRGGGGGGGGGALSIEALGSIVVTSTGVLDAHGGNGAGGEGIACSYWGGGGGGGAGGMIVLSSASSILLEAGAILDVRHGVGADASNDNDYFDCNFTGANPGDGGHGGDGLIQLQVPPGTTATVVQPGTNDSNGSLRPPSSWVDPTNTLIPAAASPVSVALSRWYDFGRAVARPPLGLLPALRFAGTDASGYVATDGTGAVIDAATSDVICGYLGQVDPQTGAWLDGEEPQPDWIPPNATVRIEFQGARALAEGSKEIDPASLTAWSADVGVASGHSFVRWRVTFDLAADGGDLTQRTRRPLVERLQLHADF